MGEVQVEVQVQKRQEKKNLNCGRPPLQWCGYYLRGTLRPILGGQSRVFELPDSRLDPQLLAPCKCSRKMVSTSSCECTRSELIPSRCSRLLSDSAQWRVRSAATTAAHAIALRPCSSLRNQLSSTAPRTGVAAEQQLPVSDASMCGCSAAAGAWSHSCPVPRTVRHCTAAG